LPDVEEDDDEYDQEVDGLLPREMRVILDTEDDVTASVGEILCRQQGDDPELGDVIAMRIADGRLPSKEKLQTHTELTKKMVNRWEDLEIYDGLVYRWKKSPHVREPNFVQLLLPRSQMKKALQQCHASGRTLRYSEDVRPSPPEILLVDVEKRYETILSTLFRVYRLPPWKTGQVGTLAAGIARCSV